MLKSLCILLTTVITSLYFFPFNCTFLPGSNTKMMVAAGGLIVLLFNLAKGRVAQMEKGFSVLSLIAIVVSLIGFVSVTYNNTPDYTYATYIVSMWVWLGGAYAVIHLMKAVHGCVSVRTVCNYLIGVCSLQCIIAFAMGLSEPLKAFVDGFLASEGFMGKVEDRLYGIGASLDVGGMRFATVLCMIAYLSVNVQKKLPVYMNIGYVVAFLLISVVGNMIGRTTTVGIAVALIYWLGIGLFSKQEHRQSLLLFSSYFVVCLVIFTSIVVYLYYTNSVVHSNIRFAFEGFFSLWEKGRWETNSNEILKSMYVFPDNLKTWIIGDGYFGNPVDTDPYYTGVQWKGFYQNTDVGYLRFIFYFGLLGMVSFVYFMYKAARVCMEHFYAYKMLFALILLMNYIVWFKVSSDLFLVLALFLCLPQEQSKTLQLRGVSQTL